MERNFNSIWEDETTKLIEPSKYRLDLIEPPSNMKKYITVFFKFHSDEPWIRDVQPANTGHMMVFLKGKGEARFFNNGAYESQPISLIGPTNAAMQYIIEGPFTCFGCTFSSLGWRAVTGLLANESNDQFIDSEKYLGPEAGQLFEKLQQIEEAKEGPEQYQQMVEAVCHFLQPKLRPVSDRHAEIMAKVVSWLEGSLNPDLEILYKSLPVGRRQAQRLIGEYFGCAPNQLMRKYRAIRAARILNDPNFSKDQLDAVQELFYDQSHMTRELRHFTGRTPAHIGGESSSLLRMWLDRENALVI